MVRIVTGKINSGKTTRIETIYHKNNLGDGFISKKIMIGSDVYGFKAKRLSDGYETMFMLHDRYYSKNDIIIDFDEESKYDYEIGPYKVLTKAISLIDNTYKNLIDDSISPLYFDEVGKLELNGLGFYQHIKKALLKNLDIYMVVREDLIDEVIRKFDITEYLIASR